MPAKRPPARQARPAPPKAAPQPTAPADAPSPGVVGAHEVVTQYRVLASGISTPTGAVYRGALVDAAALGDADRVAALLARGAIEEATDD